MSWGEDPIDHCPSEDDKAHMTVPDTRYGSRVGMTGSTRDGSGRCNRSAPIAPSKDGAVTNVQDIRERIQCGTYAVDSEAVAAAILKRLLDDEDEA